MNLSDCSVRMDWREIDLKNVWIAWWWSMSTQLRKHTKKSKYTSLMVWGSLTILCRRPPPAPPRPPPGPRWWLKTTWTWIYWGGRESNQENRHSLNSIQYKLSPVGLLIDLNHTCSCFTWASLVLPFFSSCFLSSSYFFRPSRYSATASLDGFFSSAETRKTSLLITNYS